MHAAHSAVIPLPQELESLNDTPQRTLKVLRTNTVEANYRRSGKLLLAAGSVGHTGSGKGPFFCYIII